MITIIVQNWNASKKVKFYFPFGDSVLLEEVEAEKNKLKKRRASNEINLNSFLDQRNILRQ